VRTKTLSVQKQDHGFAIGKQRPAGRDGDE
jgi:hypothetical protein